MTPTAKPPEALLRTLSPALRQLERSVRGWLAVKHRYPLSTIGRANLEGLANDLRRQGEALDVDRPLLVVLLMGGTGVGKSTLLNALAGGAIAQASFTRPTTRDPVVYYHESVRPDRLDPSLRHCRLAPHDRPGLEQKIIVDTPDLDSNDLSNRDKLVALLPIADVILYVGSQEKYHDRLGWDLFLQQRKRRAFAFVLNKWDRCVHTAGPTGVRPDTDLLRDLHAEGFENPLLFRTCAQKWIDHAATQDGPPPDLPEGEQFRELAHWIESGLTRMEIEAIKARGVSQLLHHLEHALEGAAPPDLVDVAARTEAVWKRVLEEEADASAEVLLNTLEPYQRDIEHHFTVEGQRRFHGFMAVYLYVFTRLRYIGSTLRERVSFWPRLGGKDDKAVPAPRWDVSHFTQACSDAAASRHLDARGKALANRLLLEADGQGFPVNLLTEAVESVARLDWRQRYAQALVDVLHQVEQQWSRPTGARRLVQDAIVWLGDWLPPLTLLFVYVRLLWIYAMESGHALDLSDWLVIPLVIVLVVLIILHLLIVLLLPLRWSKIRSTFGRQLRERLQRDLEGAHNPIPLEVAEALLDERRQVMKILDETREVAQWLEQREQAASIAGLYGR